jgi:hypothetical protein
LIGVGAAVTCRPYADQVAFSQRFSRYLTVCVARDCMRFNNQLVADGLATKAKPEMV